MPEQKKSGGISLTASIFLIAGAIILVFGVYSLISGGSKYRGYKKVTAEVVEAYYPENAEGTAAICVYEMNGRSYNYGHASKKHLEVGDKVTLYCNSDKPAYPVPSRIDTGAVVIIVMGAGVAVIGMFIALMSGAKGIGGSSLTSLETNAGNLIDGLESLIDESPESEPDDPDEDEPDEEDSEEEPDEDEEEAEESDSEEQPESEKKRKVGMTLEDVEERAADMINGLEDIFD